MLKNPFIYAIVPDSYYLALQVKSFPLTQFDISIQLDVCNI